MLRTLFIAWPALIFVLGIPLALNLVPPNRFYGFRTSTALSSSDAWYLINFATGLALISAGALSGILCIVLSYGVIELKPEPRYLLGILLTALVMLLALVPVVIYSNKF